MITDRNIAPGAAINPTKIMGAGLIGVGEVFYVAPSTGQPYAFLKNKVPNNHLYTSLASAYAATVSGRNDVIILLPGTHTLTAMLDVTKSYVHFIGADQRLGFGLGARSKVSLGATTATSDIATMKNTGVGNTFTGIKFMNSNTVDEGLYCVAEGGEYTVYNRCEFYKSTDLNETAAAEVLNNGDSVQWLNCTFGSTSNIIADDKIRPNMLLTRETITGKVCRDNIVDSCIFLVKSAGTEAVRIYGAGATDVERLFLVKDSIFYSNILGAATPAHAVGFGAAQTEGCVVLKNCTSVDHTVMKQASMAIYVDGAVPTHNTSGVSVTG